MALAHCTPTNNACMHVVWACNAPMLKWTSRNKTPPCTALRQCEQALCGYAANAPAVHSANSGRRMQALPTPGLSSPFMRASLTQHAYEQAHAYIGSMSFHLQFRARAKSMGIPFSSLWNGSAAEIQRSLLPVFALMAKGQDPAMQPLNTPCDRDFILASGVIMDTSSKVTNALSSQRTMLGVGQLLCFSIHCLSLFKLAKRGYDARLCFLNKLLSILP
eukprot:541037-Pelagomonas_calceolata.AAC.1